MLSYVLAKESDVPIYFHKDYKEFLFLKDEEVLIWDKNDKMNLIEIPPQTQDIQPFIKKLKNEIDFGVFNKFYSMNMNLYTKYKDHFMEIVSNNKIKVPIFDDNHLMINIRMGDIFKDDIHPHYNVIPHKFYKKIIKETKCIPVFMGQLDDNIIINSLRENFKDAIFLENTNDPYYDFELLRKSKHKCLSVSTFSYLAGYFGEPDTKIRIPICGFFNPKQRPDQNFIIDDDRFVYYNEFEVEKWKSNLEQIENIITL